MFGGLASSSLGWIIETIKILGTPLLPRHPGLTGRATKMALGHPPPPPPPSLHPRDLLPCTVCPVSCVLSSVLLLQPPPCPEKQQDLPFSTILLSQDNPVADCHEVVTLATVAVSGFDRSQWEADI